MLWLDESLNIQETLSGSTTICQNLSISCMCWFVSRDMHHCMFQHHSILRWTSIFICLIGKLFVAHFNPYVDVDEALCPIGAHGTHKATLESCLLRGFTLTKFIYMSIFICDINDHDVILTRSSSSLNYSM